jgi:hypothetical protein
MALGGEPSQRALMRGHDTVLRVGAPQLRDDAAAVRDENDLARRHVAQYLTEAGFELADADGLHAD